MFLWATILALLLAACDSPKQPKTYQSNPKPAPTKTKQIPKPPPSRTPKPPPTRTPQQANPLSNTDEIIGGGKQDAPSILTVQNLTGEVICKLFVWKTSFSNQNLLGGSLNSGQSYKLQQQFQAGYYHLLAVACNGNQISRDNTFLTGLQTWKLYYFPK